MSALNWILYAVTVGAFAALWMWRERKWKNDQVEMAALRMVVQAKIHTDDAISRMQEKSRMDFKRTGLNKTLICLLLMAGAAWEQEWQPPKPPELCGTQTSTAATNSITVQCIDFDALAKLGVPGVYGQRMQVHIQAKYGDVVRVRAYYTDAEGKEAYDVQYGDVNPNQDGSLGALVQFLGWQYTRVEVRVYRGEQ